MAEGNPEKKEWSKPQLFVLARGSEARVLDGCKSGLGLSVRPHGPGFGGCMYARGWRDCQADCCTGDYTISLDSYCGIWEGVEYYRGCYCACHVPNPS